jgi:putative transposase
MRKERKYLLKIHIHLVFLTRQTGNLLTPEIITRLEELFNEICLQKKCKLLNFHGEQDYVRLLISLHSTVSISSLIGKLKGKSSYFLLKEFPGQLKDSLIKKHFWSSSYCAVSDTSTALEEIKAFLDKN